MSVRSLFATHLYQATVEDVALLRDLAKSIRTLAASASLDTLAATSIVVPGNRKVRLDELATRFPMITQVRGEGLMLGVVLDRPGAPIVQRCLADGLLINCTADRVLRFLPPLVIERALVDDGLAILEKALAAA